MNETGLACPDCTVRGMVRIAPLTYRCRDHECNAVYDLRCLIERMWNPCQEKAPPPSLTIIEGAR